MDAKEIKDTCLRRVETTMNYEKDPNLQKQIEESGKAICKCVSEQSVEPSVLHKVLNDAIRAIPKYTVTRPERKKLT